MLKTKGRRFKDILAEGNKSYIFEPGRTKDDVRVRVGEADRLKKGYPEVALPRAQPPVSYSQIESRFIVAAKKVLNKDPELEIIRVGQATGLLEVTYTSRQITDKLRKMAMRAKTVEPVATLQCFVTCNDSSVDASPLVLDVSANDYIFEVKLQLCATCNLGLGPLQHLALLHDGTVVQDVAVVQQCEMLEGPETKAAPLATSDLPPNKRRKFR
ncbi:hypothetical protein SPRG_09437 [Saprolegnia parasitica CBS 223.65]|uniref:Ubiquitin-like domain-containing protein n=1 Tax=Saprolegnia parasitica (strain CBS 223.65) TaxID=695850 RepID=A0A067C3S5_SAPPC|nr:hypothetical protein SPRG_09437 [Saprolegnia parasitica CBS 223.65]KDO25163.1 hypothetical protein SPRG_09437 [Saprolegnia parasitica CBS 223.65]|eukprot:XP_012204031.1 hypothetical protein SPRG_09437 [Saprolegnia parasitica CBS 223.65]